jgi:hypothetical protein
MTTHTLTYYDTATNTSLKSFIVQAPGVNCIKLFPSSLKHGKLKSLGAVKSFIVRVTGWRYNNPQNDFQHNDIPHKGLICDTQHK